MGLQLNESLNKTATKQLRNKNLHYVGLEVFTAVTTKNAVFLDLTPCGCCYNRSFRGTYHLNQ
jgi:hypothetical protein